MEDLASTSLMQELRAFVVDHFLYGQDDGTLGPQDSFLERGIIDSTGVLELVAFLEERYGIQVQDEDLIPENLDSLEALAQFVQRKQQQGGAP